MDQDLLFPLHQPTVATVDRRLFPVRRVHCIGRNYADHAREMGSDPKTEPPFFFGKPSDAVHGIADGLVGAHPYPPLTADYQPEVELVVFLAGGGTDIPAQEALALVYGYAVGFDMTRRDAQARMKEGRRPWEVGKGFDLSGPVGAVVPAERTGPLSQGAIVLTVNGRERQRDDLASMIWSVPEQIAELSRWSALAPGDVIFTGTPAGVAPVVRGDELVGHIDGLPELRLRIA